MIVRGAVLSVVILLIVAPIVFASDDPKGHASWWVSNYSAVTASEDPLVARADSIFRRVSAAADKKSNRLPRLVVIRAKADPWAIALRDGSVVLTNEAVRLCYRGVNEEKGDSRLAFILGHELSHLAKDDFWHMAAFSAVRTFSDEAGVKNALMDHLVRTGDALPGDSASRSFARTKELQADSYGVVYMVMAGYEPRAIIDNDGTNFFEEWVSQVTGRISYHDESHPSAPERATFLRSQLAAVAEDLDYFDFGVRLLQIGRHYEAVKFLEAFREKFPGREVLGNIGFSYFQQAMRTLAICDKSLVQKFRLSTLLDSETLGRKFRLRGDRQEEHQCFQKEAYRNDIARAISNLEAAARMDSGYLPARINLSSALIMAGEYAKALSVIDEVLKIAPEDEPALNNKAIALFLFGRSSGISTAETALALIQSLLNRSSSNGQALYNKAAILSESGRTSSADEAWQGFLNIERTGPHADAVRERLKIRADQEKVSRPVGSMSSPVRLGDMDSKTAADLKGARKKEFNLGELSGEIIEHGGNRILALDYSIEIVERRFDERMSGEDFKARFGDPETVIVNVRGSTFVYQTFAVDIIDGRIAKIVYFQKEKG
ncbi:MAG: M48 family metalloprotease [Nitrospirae bacterium]|nr:M48 family metalloprotease [Nitrospirota bacterium]